MQVKLTDKTVRNHRLPSREEVQLELWDTVLPGFGVRLGWKGRRSFMVQTRISGKQRRFTIGTHHDWTLGQARQEARQILDAADRGLDPKAQREQERKENERHQATTVRGVFDRWMQEHVHAKQLRSARDYQQRLDADVFPAWGDRSIHDITRADVRHLLWKKAETAPVQANRVLTLIRSAFNWSVDEDIVETNPAARITPPGPERQRERVLTDYELRLFWEAAQRMGLPWGSFYMVAALLAQRKNEVARMTWDQVERTSVDGLQGGFWYMSSELAKEGVGHLVPLPETAMLLIEEQPRVGRYVFMSGYTQGPLKGFSRAKLQLDRMMLQIAQEEMVKRGEDPETAYIKPWRIHDLRRTAATRMRENRVARATVSRVLNHHEGGTTGIYDRFAMDPQKRAALEIWANYVERLEGYPEPQNLSPASGELIRAVGEV